MTTTFEYFCLPFVRVLFSCVTEFRRRREMLVSLKAGRECGAGVLNTTPLSLPASVARETPRGQDRAVKIKSTFLFELVGEYSER